MSFLKRLFGRGSKEGGPTSTEPEEQKPPQLQPEALPVTNMLLKPVRAAEIIEPSTAVIEEKPKLPGQDKMLTEPTEMVIVHADDRQSVQDELAEQDYRVFRGLVQDSINGEKNGVIVAPTNWREVLTLALQVNVGPEPESIRLPADVVVLDHDYQETAYTRNWSIRPEEFLALAEALGIEMPPALAEFRDIFGKVDSTSLAILLRCLGYTGSIIILSSVPPYPYEIFRMMDGLKRAVPELSLEFPVQGVVYKQATISGEMDFATTWNEGGDGTKLWNAETAKHGSTFAHSLNALLKKLKNQ